MIQLQNFTDFTIDVMHEASITGEFEKGFALLEQHRKVLATGLEPEMFHKDSLVFLDAEELKSIDAIMIMINNVIVCTMFLNGKAKDTTWHINTIGELIDKVGTVSVSDNYVKLLKL